jgi:Ca2+-binding EF-hand superfamily protein
MRTTTSTSIGALVGLMFWALPVHAQTPSAPDPTAGRAADRDASTVDGAFQLADRDGDGRLSNDELSQFPSLAARLHDLDADRDGFVSRAEFSAGVTVKRD